MSIKVTRIVSIKGDDGPRLTIDVSLGIPTQDASDQDLGQELRVALVEAIRDKSRHESINELKVADDTEGVVSQMVQSADISSGTIRQALAGAQLVLERVAGEKLNALMLVWDNRSGNKMIIHHATSADEHETLAIVERWTSHMKRPRA